MISQTKSEPTGLVISSYYRVHPDDCQKFVNAVVAHLATVGPPGDVKLAD